MVMLYNQVAKNLKGSAIMPLAFIVFMAILIASANLWIEDYMTSVYGYEAVPSQKVTASVIWAVAALPQLLQMGAAYLSIGLSKSSKEQRGMFGLDTLWITILIWLFALGIDSFWDYSFKAAPLIAQNPNTIYWGVVIEAVVVFGIMSEVLGTFALAMVVALIKEGAFTELIDLLVEIAEMIAEAISLIITTIGKIAGVLITPFKSDKKPSKPTRGQSPPPRENKVKTKGINNITTDNHQNEK
jgi:hypothetical protein